MRATESILRLDREVSVGEPEAGTLILVSARAESKPLRLKGHATKLVQRLADGCTESELVVELRSLTGVAAPLDETVAAFVAQLRSAGMLDGNDPLRSSPPHAGVRRIALPNPDRLVKPAGNVLSTWPRWLHLMLWPSLAGGAVAVASFALARGALPSVFELSLPAGLLGLMLLPFWVVAHETAHAVACRAAGCPVSGAGVELRRFSLPSFFVDTRALHLLPGRAPKVAVALAGPLVDTLFAAALLATLTFAEPGELARPALQLATYCILFGLFFNLSPFRRSDGSNALSSALGDPFLPVRAFARSPVGASSRFALRAYRAGGVLYGAVAISLLVLVFQMTYFAIKPSIEAYAAQARSADSAAVAKP